MSELWNILLDSFWKIFLPGLKVTIPLTVISFSIALVIATAMAMVQFANIKGLCCPGARFYIWIFRGDAGGPAFIVFWDFRAPAIAVDDFRQQFKCSIEGAYSTETMRAAWKPFQQAARSGCVACRICRSCGNYPSAGDAHRFPAASS